MWLQMAYLRRFNSALRLLTLLLQIYLLKVVWTTVYAESGGTSGFNLDTLVSYLTLTNLQLWLMTPNIANFLRERVRQGQVALDLARPIPFLSQMFIHQLGATAGAVPFVVLSFPLAVIAGRLQTPASALAATVYPISLMLGYLIAMFAGVLLGLTSFWTLEMNGITTMYVLVSQFFSGALVPIRFFPPALNVLASLLPFQAQISSPALLYLGQITGADLVHALFLQIIWVGILYILVRLLWHRSLDRLVIQGG